MSRVRVVGSRQLLAHLCLPSPMSDDAEKSGEVEASTKKKSTQTAVCC